MLTLVVLAKLILEIALFAFAAQAVVGVLAGAGRVHNPVYRFLQVATRPWIRAMRWVCPRGVADRHLPWMAFVVLLVLWCAAVVAKVGICLQIGLALCR
ncbi:MAG: hypothetical protein V4625_12940 [Pseudomonadota bacterium]